MKWRGRQNKAIYSERVGLELSKVAPGTGENKSRRPAYQLQVPAASASGQPRHRLAHTNVFSTIQKLQRFDTVSPLSIHLQLRHGQQLSLQ